MNKPFNFLIFFCLSLLPLLPKAEAQIGQSLRFNDDYATFVRILGENVKDPKFVAALRTGKCPEDRIEFEINVAYPVKDLIPTQNEIDIEKSLKYPLQKESPEVLTSYLKAAETETFAPGGPIVTAGGRYIIDGHHRWSQLYLINPNAKIRAINMKITDPVAALKFTQMAIGAVASKIPISIVEGQNLITMKMDDFKSWITKANIAQSTIDAFGKAEVNGLDAITKKIWANAFQMQTQNAPIPGAANRGLMPQTDEAPGWREALERCIIDIR